MTEPSSFTAKQQQQQQQQDKYDTEADDDLIVPWTDDCIRWTQDKAVKPDADDNDNDSNEGAFLDPFADPNPMQEFHFHFDTSTTTVMDVTIVGYKHEADAVWQSTGLTVWRAAEYLCQYMIKQQQLVLQNKTVLELGAGLGLCGIVAHRLGAKHVCITDGDSQTLPLIRTNLKENLSKTADTTNKTVTVQQLLWGKDTTQTFIQQRHKNKQAASYQVIIASDIVYAAGIVQPLWETILLLLQKQKEAIFIMAYAKRDVPVTIDNVLQAADNAGFDFKMVEQDPQGIWVYQFTLKQEFYRE